MESEMTKKHSQSRQLPKRFRYLHKAEIGALTFLAWPIINS